MSAAPDFAAIIAEALHQQTHTEWPEEIGPTTEGCDEEEGWVDAAYLLYGEAANVTLAAPIAAMCPDCKGTGTAQYAPSDNDYGATDWHPCHHPNAPTIARLLAIGEAVWTATETPANPEYDADGESMWTVNDGPPCYFADDLMHDLKAVGG